MPGNPLRSLIQKPCHDGPQGSVTKVIDLVDFNMDRGKNADLIWRSVNRIETIVTIIIFSKDD